MRPTMLLSLLCWLIFAIATESHAQTVVCQGSPTTNVSFGLFGRDRRDCGASDPGLGMAASPVRVGRGKVCRLCVALAPLSRA